MKLIEPQGGAWGGRAQCGQTGELGFKKLTVGLGKKLRGKNAFVRVRLDDGGGM